MFIPSDAIYLMINELRFYEVIEQALQKKVWICSPTTLYIVLNQIILANRNWELHKSSAKILQAYLEIAREFSRFDKRWQEVSKSLTGVVKKVSEFETTIAKIIKKNEDLQIAMQLLRFNMCIKFPVATQFHNFFNYFSCTANTALQRWNIFRDLFYFGRRIAGAAG